MSNLVLLAGMMLGLLEDLAEISTIDESAEVFEYLERATPAMRSHFDFIKPSGAAKLSVLRICNQLLRRLSRAHHVVLGGRIHLFLAQLMPLSDRSAVNAASHVNTSHATEVEEVPEVGPLCTRRDFVNPFLSGCTSKISLALSCIFAGVGC